MYTQEALVKLLEKKGIYIGEEGNSLRTAIA